MDPSLSQQALDLVTQKNIRYDIRVVDPKKREGRIGEIYAQCQRVLLTVPEPVTVHSPSPDILAGFWAMFHETLLTGTIPRGTKEIIATAVSSLNECPWCVDAHSIGLYS